VDPAKKASAMGGVTLYGTSKLMNVLHAKALAIHAPWLVVNAVHPGVIKTELHDEHGSTH
jgi:NAD(P)-dependent dehydrogenase (short-subunit alcohol dehydrogenase family)